MRFKSTKHLSLTVAIEGRIVRFENGFFQTDEKDLIELLMNSPSNGVSFNPVGGSDQEYKEISEQLVKVNRKTSWNAKRQVFHVVIGCQDFSQLSGMPIYNYRLGREFVRLGCDVTVVAPTIGGDLTKMARKAGIRVFSYQSGKHLNSSPSVLLLNELWSKCLLADFPDAPAWYYCHSKYDCDAPIEKRPQIRGYFAPRKQVADYWMKKTGYKIAVIPIPIPFDEFSQVRTKRHKTYRILVPCTFNEIREPMVRDIIKRARADKKVEVLFKGTDYGVLEKLELPGNCRWEDASPDIRPYMHWADEVAGIFVGTVTLEAWAMGKATSVYDEKGRCEMGKPPKGFRTIYDSAAVAKRFLELFREKWADIVIPHYDQRELLAQTLGTIPLQNYNVIVVRGGTFAQNCNKGAKLAETDNLIFANDDLLINPQALWEMLDAKEELVGVQQFYPNGEALCVGIFINQFGNYELTNKPKKAMYPSGALFRIKRHVFEEVGGFDERFRNGGEDQDLFLKALEAGYRTGFVDSSVVHYCSQSTGRFDYVVENDETLHKLWPKKRLEKVLGKHYARKSDLQYVNEFGNIDLK